MKKFVKCFTTYNGSIFFVPPERLELSHLTASDPKSDVSTIPPRRHF